MSIVDLKQNEIYGVAGGQVDLAEKYSIVYQYAFAVLFNVSLAFLSLAPHKKSDSATGRCAMLKALAGEISRPRRLLAMAVSIVVTAALLPVSNMIVGKIREWEDS